MRDLLLKQGAEAYALSSAEFARVVARDVEKWAKVVRISGAKANYRVVVVVVIPAHGGNSERALAFARHEQTT